VTHVMITRTATGEHGSSRVAHCSSSPTQSKASVGSICSPDVVDNIGSSRLGSSTLRLYHKQHLILLMGGKTSDRPEWTTC